MVFLLTVLFLFSRILYLLFSCADLSHEEFLRGTIAKELIEGLKIPFFDHMPDHYQGGALVYGVFTVPFFLLFGKSVFSLRLTAILFQYGAFITWYSFMKCFFGSRPALYTAFLYLLPPPWLTLFSTFANGSHAESLFFTAFGLFFLFRILYEKRSPIKDAVWLGLLSGFGTYFSYTTFASVVSFILFWGYEDRNVFRKKEFFCFILFFLIGFSPWIFYNVSHPFKGMEPVRIGFVYPYPERLFIIPFRFLKLATLKVLGVLSFNYRQGVDYYHPHLTPLNFIYYVALLSSFFFLYRYGKEDRKRHFFFLFPLVYLSLASISRFVMDTYVNRYFIPLFPFFFATLALGLSHLESRPGNFGKVSFVALILLLAMGAKGEANLLSMKDFKLSLKYQGYSYDGLGWALSYRHFKDFERASYLGKRLAGDLSDSERLAFYHGLSHFEFDVKQPEDLKKYLSWVKTLDEKYQPFFLKEMGYWWGASEGHSLETIGDGMGVFNQEEQPYFIEGFMSSFEFSEVKPESIFGYALRERMKLSPSNQKALVYGLGKVAWQISSPEKWLSPGLLPYYYRGVGAHLATLYHPLYREWPFPPEQKFKEMDPKWQEAIYWGAGFEVPLHYEDPFEYERMTEGISPHYRSFFKQGLSDRFSGGGRNTW